MQVLRVRNDKKNWGLVLLFYLLTFHDPLTRVVSVLNYIDEGVAVFGVLIMICEMIKTKKLLIYKSDRRLILAMTVFVIAGLLGNVLYRYQKTVAVLIDLVTNLKFFLAIITGYKLFQYYGYERVRFAFNVHAKVVSLLLFILLIANLMLNIFPTADRRYGIASERLFFFHPTYLASAAAFLLVVLTAFYDRGSGLYILMTLVIMFFTLRLKAIAGIAVYCAIYFFIIYQRKKITFWHVVVLACMAVIIAFDQIAYYYIENADRSARALLTLRSLEIASDYFPIGTGFGTFASDISTEHYSPIYSMYGLSGIWGLMEGYAFFASDTFWPIIIGQTGVVGTICYVFVLFTLFRRILQIRKVNILFYATGMYVFVYLIISSTSEAAFCNAISIPLAVMMGCILTLERRTDI